MNFPWHREDLGEVFPASWEQISDQAWTDKEGQTDFPVQDGEGTFRRGVGDVFAGSLWITGMGHQLIG